MVSGENKKYLRNHHLQWSLDPQKVNTSDQLQLPTSHSLEEHLASQLSGQVIDVAHGHLASPIASPVAGGGWKNPKNAWLNLRRGVFRNVLGCFIFHKTSKMPKNMTPGSFWKDWWRIPHEKNKTYIYIYINFRNLEEMSYASKDTGETLIPVMC